MKFILAFAFLSAAVVNLAGPKAIRAEFAKWGYPDWFRVAISAVELGGVILLCITGAEWIGASILLVVTLGILMSFTRSREWMRMQYPFVLFLLLAAVLQQPHA
ncbi:DoxX family protein [Cupriavidus sp. D39]|uniref:DoxX family protein n=1 Tax=Cupriavidus sp. D39 TaxID=2997877 RepID=UPI00227155CA|nr:DoxX family protein [Cupriavidus sp. D39]MCY0854728.1 DoxX family protein [Cupriavidus sp. D39]